MVHIGEPVQSFIMQSVKMNRPKPHAVTHGLLPHLYVEWICRPKELHFLDVQSNQRYDLKKKDFERVSRHS